MPCGLVTELCAFWAFSFFSCVPRQLAKQTKRNGLKGTRVVVITMPDQSLHCCGQVGTISSVRSEGIQQAMFDHGRSATYKVKMDKSHHDVAFGFGIIDAPSILSAKAGKVVADLNRDGVFETFRDCTSREGAHLTICSGQPLKGSRLWHAYFYLGYDTEPSCVERDFE